MIRRNQILAALVALAAGIACQQETPVYEATNEAIYNGSIYYSQQGCAGCHGTEYNGTGPDAATAGAPVPDLTLAPDVDETPLRYFKAITKGTERMPAHQYQSVTDRGRWAMAHFLYSRGAPVTGADREKHRAALARDKAETRAAYETQRRWVMGFQAPAEREGAPELSSLPGAGAVAPEAAQSSVSEARRELRDPQAEGAQLYANNCQSCHGMYGEGRARAVRFGLVECDERERQCGVYLSTADFTRTGVGTLGGFRGAHANVDGMNLRTYDSWTESEWQSVYNYVRSLLGQ